jgi:hypothetical protein
MSMKRTCPISNFTSAPDDMRFLYHNFRLLTSELRDRGEHFRYRIHGKTAHWALDAQSY